MTHWSTDISTAPRGKTVTVTRTIKGEQREIEEQRREYILAVQPDNTVVMTRWIPPRYTQSGKLLEGNRWSGFNLGSEPIAWAPWPTYEAPADVGRSEFHKRNVEKFSEALHAFCDGVGGEG